MDDIHTILDKAEADIFAIASDTKKNEGLVKIGPIVNDMVDTIYNKRNSNISDFLLPGYSKLDELMGGLQNSDLIVIAARPSMGKTALSMNFAQDFVFKQKKKVGFFSLEMANNQLAMRLLCAEGRVDSHLVRTGKLPKSQWKNLSIAVGQLAEAPIFLDDTAGMSVLEVRAKARRLKAEHGVGLIIVDYLQLMTGEYGKSSGNREQEIASISRSLKAIAKELNVPVLALSQLSRAVETRGGDKRPVLSDLREAGSIEQDADMVVFVYRADRYDITEDEDGNLTAGIAELLLRKNRNGPTGKVKLKFIERYAKFADFSTLDNREVSKFKSKANNDQKTNSSLECSEPNYDPPTI